MTTSKYYEITFIADNKTQTRGFIAASSVDAIELLESEFKDGYHDILGIVETDSPAFLAEQAK